MTDELNLIHNYSAPYAVLVLRNGCVETHDCKRASEAYDLFDVFCKAAGVSHAELVGPDDEVLAEYPEG